MKKKVDLVAYVNVEYPFRVALAKLLGWPDRTSKKLQRASKYVFQKLELRACRLEEVLNRELLKGWEIDPKCEGVARLRRLLKERGSVLPADLGDETFDITFRRAAKELDDETLAELYLLVSLESPQYAPMALEIVREAQVALAALEKEDTTPKGTP